MPFSSEGASPQHTKHCHSACGCRLAVTDNYHRIPEDGKRPALLQAIRDLKKLQTPMFHAVQSKFAFKPLAMANYYLCINDESRCLTKYRMRAKEYFERHIDWQEHKEANRAEVEGDSLGFAFFDDPELHLSRKVANEMSAALELR